VEGVVVVVVVVVVVGDGQGAKGVTAEAVLPLCQ
jgi:hypothetical protein